MPKLGTKTAKKRLSAAIRSQKKAATRVKKARKGVTASKKRKTKKRKK